ncbi:MAG: hypothetical protein NTY12_00720 [Candidatus Falkowbacteria bacterium]|nr:hypothetical protein [Candidatus Falkowbacteria bacterium]
MKGQSRTKVCKRTGSPAFRTPSFFKNKQRVVTMPKTLVDKTTKFFGAK